MSRNYKYLCPTGLHFVTATTADWVDIFSRQVYRPGSLPPGRWRHPKINQFHSSKQFKMKSKLLFLFLVLTQILSAQTFTEVLQLTPFDGVGLSSIAISDVNGDGHKDVLITGQNSSFGRISKLYTNDGMGNFTEMTGTPFDGVERSSIAFSDVNSDGHKDVLITGQNSSFGRISKLYTNDGMGNFTEMTGTPFDSVSKSSIAFSDVNGDGHEDVLVTGQATSGERISKLYTNDGTGNFTEMTGTPFADVWYSSIAFSDVNGDGHKDVLITGQGSSGIISKLYTNDGTGNFTEMMGTPFIGVWYSSIAFSDVNGDGHEDVLITGESSPSGIISKLYTNDGTGNFTEMTGTPFEGVWYSSIAFSDVNGDGYEDVLITGQTTSGERISKLYINDGKGNFTEMMGTPFVGVARSSIAFSDVNGDGHEDVLITGQTTSGERISKLYTNDGMVNSTDDLILGFDLEFTLHPNPSTSNFLNVRFHSVENGFAMLKVYDLHGRLLSQQKESTAIGQQTFSIDIASLPSGRYFIQIDNDKRKGIAKFMIQ